MYLNFIKTREIFVLAAVTFSLFGYKVLVIQMIAYLEFLNLQYRFGSSDRSASQFRSSSLHYQGF